MKIKFNWVAFILTFWNVMTISLTSCKSDHKEQVEISTELDAEKNSMEMIYKELENFFEKFNNGLHINVEMAKIKEIDKEVKDFIVDGKSTGNYKAEGSNEQIEWERFYANSGAQGTTTLFELRFQGVNKTLETDAGIKNIDLTSIAEKINKITGISYVKGKQGELDENLFYWQSTDYFCWMEPGVENSFTVYIRKEKP